MKGKWKKRKEAIARGVWNMEKGFRLRSLLIGIRFRMRMILVYISGLQRLLLQTVIPGILSDTSTITIPPKNS